MNPKKSQTQAAPTVRQTRARWDTEVGNANKFVELHQNDMRYDPVSKDWYLWDGKRFVRNPGGKEAEFMAQEIIDYYDDQRLRALQAGDATKAEAYGKWAVKTSKNSMLNSMMALVQTHPQILMHPGQQNTDPLLLNTQTGVYDFSSGLILPHMPKDNHVHITAVEIGDKDRCPLWMETLNEVFQGDQELIDYFQKIAGYSLTGLTGMQAFFFLYGSGANGKSTIVRTLAGIMGDYAEPISSNALMSQKYATNSAPELASMVGKRMAYTSELGKGKHLAEDTIKDITGGDLIQVRQLYGLPFTMEPIFKLWMMGNHKPRVTGTDHGIWRRVKLIPFEARIRRPKAQYHEKLIAAEGEHILAWAIDGFRMFLEADGNLARIDEPQAVRDATEKYRVDEDALSDFFDLCLERQYLDPFLDSSTGIGGQAPWPGKELFEVYQAMVKDKQLEKPLTVRKFYAALEERGIARRKGNPPAFYINEMAWTDYARKLVPGLN